MTESIWILTLTAASIGFVHTVIGPDHYLPFIMMSKAQGWTRTKTMWITFLCGIGHVLSSVLLGAVGVAFGVALQQLEIIESVRGEWAAWLLITFGILYALWGVRVAVKNRTHEHSHSHDDGTEHVHEHTHLFGIRHGHRGNARTLTTWALFTIFVLGPCEPLIPLLIYPAATQSTAGLLLVTAVFGVVTIVTMMSMVYVVSLGWEAIRNSIIERYTHAIAGGMIAVSGLAIMLLGL